MSLCRLFNAVALSLALAGAACASSDSSAETTDDEITNIPTGTIKDQSETGNCWLYATTAWAESLAADPTTGKVKELSTAYLVYWNFYDQILTSHGKRFRGVEWTGGSWGQAVEIVLRYGLMAQYDFTHERSAQADATIALDAMTAINTSLKSGALRRPASRRDPVLVRQELNRAFKLDPELARALDAAFGEDGTKTFVMSTHGDTTPILAPSEVRVRSPREGASALEETTLSEAIGQRAADDPDVRVGAFAWRKAEAPRPSDPAARSRELRAFLKRVQIALHHGVPVPISWCVEEDGQDGRKRYSKPVSGVLDGDCAHETLIVDYEAKLANGHVLEADREATAEELEQALRDDTELVFLRVKNSWGLDDAPKSGFTDLYLSYLESSIRACPDRDASSAECVDWTYMLDEVTLPPGF